MSMEKITIEKAKTIAKNKGLYPAKIKGTSGLQFTKGGNSRIVPCTWEEFEAGLQRRGLAVYEAGGWMKLMKA